MKVLVTAASKHGSTVEIANAVAETLRASDLDVDVVAPRSVDTLDGYDAVVLGSAVYAGHWLAPAKAFVRRHRIALRERQVFLFSSGPIGDSPKPDGDPVDVADLVEASGAVDHRVFAGRLTPSELGGLERLITQIVHAEEGDFRAWDEIAAWATEIATSLKEGAVREPVAV